MFTASHTNWSTPFTYTDWLTRLDVFRLEGPDEHVVYEELNDDTQLCGGCMYAHGLTRLHSASVE